MQVVELLINSSYVLQVYVPWISRIPTIFTSVFTLKILNFEDHFHMSGIWMTNTMTVPFSHYNCNSKFDNLVNWQTFPSFLSVTNNAVLSKFNWKWLNLKGGNKRPFNDLKICKAVKGKHGSSMFYPLGRWSYIQASWTNLRYVCS